MSMEGLVAGNFGQVVTLTVNDVDTNAAADISGYTTAQQMIFKDPDGNEATETAAFDSDGSDGLVTYTLTDGDIDEGGTWNVRVKVTSGSAELKSRWLEFFVEAE